MNATSGAAVFQRYYRYGVLEGNHNEERFGLDLVEKPKYRIRYLSETHDRIGLHSSAASEAYKATNNFIRQDAHKEKFTVGAFAVEVKDRNEKGIAHQFSKTEEAMQRQQAKQKELEAFHDMKKDVGFTHRGEKLHVFFGHGVDDSKFENRQLVSTNTLSYDQKVRPQHFIGSKFETNPQTTNLPGLDRDTVYNKQHLKSIKSIGDKTDLRTNKPFKPYNEFTKKFDAVQSKIQWRK